MKKYLGLALMIGLFVLAGAAQAEDDIPNLVGAWQAQMDVTQIHSARGNFVKRLEKVEVFIDSQQGRAFSGRKLHHAGGKVVSENISGVIDWDDKTIYVVDHDKGLTRAAIESPTDIRGVYLEDGPEAKVVLITWKKMK